MTNRPTPWFRFLWMALGLLLPGLARASAPVTIKFQYWGGFEEIPSIDRIVTSFNATHPGIRVIAQRTPGGGSYTQKMLVQAAGGVAPDVVFVEVDGIVPLIDKGVLLPLNPYLKATKDFDLKDYYPQVLKRFTRNGNIYILPRDTAPVCVVYYNKKLFDEAGVRYPRKGWSWSYDPDRVRKTGMDPADDFLTVCRKLSKVGKDGRVKQWAWDGGFQNFALSSGAREVDNVDNPTRILYDDPRWLRAIEFQADMMNKYRVMPSQLDYAGENTNAVDLFIQGRLAMHLSGIWDSPNFRQIKDFDWDVVQFPTSEHGGKGWLTGGSGYGITRDSKHPAEAAEFVRYLAGPPGERVQAAFGRAQPALMSLANSPVWNDAGKPLHKGETVNDAPRFAVYSPFSMGWPAAKQEIYSELDRVWSGDETAAVAMAKAVPRAQKRLDDFRRRPNYPPLSWPWAFAAVGAVVALLVGIVVVAAKRDMGGNPTRAMKREALAGYLAISPWVVGFLLFTAGPLVVSMVMAFCQWDVIGPARWAGLDNFRRLAGDDPLIRTSLMNTLFYTVFSVPLGVVGALAVAMLLNTGVRGLRGFRTLYYLPAVTSAVAASVLWKWIFNPDYGLLNALVSRLHLLPVLHAIGLTNPNTGQMMWLVDEAMAKPSLILMSLWGVGGGMVIFLAGLQGVPAALYEAAEIDGAGPVSRFRNVTLPMLTPTIFFTLIMGVIGSFQVFTQALIMTDGGPHNATLFYVLYLYRAAFQDLQMGYASAMAWLLFVIILGVTLVQFRFSRWVYYEGGALK